MILILIILSLYLSPVYYPTFPVILYVSHHILNFFHCIALVDLDKCMFLLDISGDVELHTVVVHGSP